MDLIWHSEKIIKFSADLIWRSEKKIYPNNVVSASGCPQGNF